jgi:hypothetical protein
MDRKLAKIIREQRRKEREETKRRHATNSHTTINKTIE